MTKKEYVDTHCMKCNISICSGIGGSPADLVAIEGFCPFVKVKIKICLHCNSTLNREDALACLECGTEI